jgi:putative transposase
MNPRRVYSTDLTDAEWRRLEPLVPAPKPGGRPVKYPRREIVNAIFYLLRTGCSWRLLPHDFPPWRIVFYYFWQWRKAGMWEQIHDTLRGDLRQALGKQRQPSAALLDSQSVKTTEKGGCAVSMRASWSRAASATC